MKLNSDKSILLEYGRLFGIAPEILELCEKVLEKIGGVIARADKTAEICHLKVLSAMQRARLSEAHLGTTTGYGYNDLGRDALEKIYADVFKTEEALVRPQIISGTHALAIALSGNLRHGDELVSTVGQPYDTLLGVIGVRKTRGSLIENGIIYKEARLKPDGSVDFSALREAISDKTRLVTIQRSKGYSFRHSLSIDETAEIIAFVKSIRRDIICLVDNCYCEFVEEREPGEAGADMTVGSLIKNAGGGLSPVGGYIAGTEECIENAAARLTAPGLGREVGPTLGVIPAMAQGLFLAPTVVSAAVKGAALASGVFAELGYNVSPGPFEQRSDIVQAINFEDPGKLLSFCRGIQKAAPVDSFVIPEPWDMPGYGCPVVMAAGAFVQGSSIELSADAPMRPPYTAFLQGGLTWQHAKAGLIIALNEMYKEGYIEL